MFNGHRRSCRKQQGTCIGIEMTLKIQQTSSVLGMFCFFWIHAVFSGERFHEIIMFVQQNQTHLSRQI